MATLCHILIANQQRGGGRQSLVALKAAFSAFLIPLSRRIVFSLFDLPPVIDVVLSNICRAGRKTDFYKLWAMNKFVWLFLTFVGLFAMVPPFVELLHCELMLMDVSETDPAPADFPLFLSSQSSLPFTRIEILVKVTTLCYHAKCCRRGEYSKEFLVETTADRTIGEVTTNILDKLEFSEAKAKEHGLSIVEISKKFASCQLNIKNSRLVRDGRTYIVTVPDEAFC